ncbi:MAG: hypothetical protein EZS28_046325 [Streblomastix strix]|uniref:Uncharacterized protein n=1 Tax=Streblomastix strix TaxID=222440 RepID=A0A5J4TJ19_9EUKA|nr:MAG: hypothetical protein EZS28_046325 [Streblomastix strix]
MIKILESEGYIILLKSAEIIINIIKAGLIELNEGQQHPYLQQLIDDGSVTKLVELFKLKKLDMAHFKIAQMLSMIYKSRPLQLEIGENVIDQLKVHNDYKGLEFLAEESQFDSFQRI